MKPFLGFLGIIFVAAHGFAAETSHWERFFPSGLVDAQGRPVAARSLEGKLVCLYFSASWCGPCKLVTPRLAALRDQSNGALEVVLVSQDRSEAEQMKYMRDAEMKWPAVKWADYKDNAGNEVRTVISKYQAWGIPAVVILSRAGDTVDADARMKVQMLPEDYLNHLESYDYGEAATRYRAEREEKGEKVTPEQQQEYVQRLRARQEATIREIKTVHAQSLKPKPLGPKPSWEDLLANFHSAQRKATAK